MALPQNIKAEISERASKWSQRAEERETAQPWLEYSRRVAFVVLRELKRLKLSHADLAAKMGVSRQHITKIVKGKENLTIETISKLELALSIRILHIPLRDTAQQGTKGDPREFEFVIHRLKSLDETKHNPWDVHRKINRVIFSPLGKDRAVKIYPDVEAAENFRFWAAKNWQVVPIEHNDLTIKIKGASSDDDLKISVNGNVITAKDVGGLLEFHAGEE